MKKYQPFALHASTVDFMCQRDGEYYLQIWFERKAKVDVIWLRTEPNNEEHLSEGYHVETNALWHVWEAKLERDRSKEVTHYCFMFNANKHLFYLDAFNVSSVRSPKDLQFKINFVHQPPAWVASQNFYQIFPERFCNGDPATTPKKGGRPNKAGDGAMLQNWGDKPKKEWGGNSFFGGDIAGIQQNINYLTTSGFTSLYLTPIFVSRSNHKYDTEDYYKIDPNFGTNDGFIDFVQALHNQDMKIVLDAVVNHTSVFHPWFNLKGEHDTIGAHQSPESSYREFYSMKYDGENVEYVSWNGISLLPKLNYASSALHDLVYQHEDSILKHWLKAPYKIDGWRMDVIQMIGESGTARNNDQIVKGMREAVKSVNEDAYFLGEHFAEATTWLQGDQEDGAMNYYGFRQPVTNFLQPGRFGDKIDAATLDEWLRMSRAKIPFANQLTQFNLLGSHDTERFLFLMKGDSRKMKMGLILLYTYIGVPCVYYGDEIGLTGGGDPDNRRCFDWHQQNWDQGIKSTQETLAHFRLRREELQQGACISLYAQGRIVVFARFYHGHTSIVAINDGAEKEVLLDVGKANIYAGELESLFETEPLKVVEGKAAYTLPAKSGSVWFTS